MAKKSKLLKRLDAQAAAETEARKQKALAEGQYAVNPDTGKAMGETPIIAQEQVVETVNTPGFENTSLVKSPDSKRTLASALDVQTQNQNVSSAISSGNVGKMGQLGITPKFSNEQIDANLPILDANEVIAQKENADQMVQSDSALAKLQANTPEEVAAIYSATQELQQKIDNVGQATIDERTSSVFPKYEQVLSTPSEDGDTYVTERDLQQGLMEIDEETKYGMTPEAQEKLGLMQKLINSGRVRTSEPAIERLGVSDYFPDINQPLAKGNYSGSIVGSNTIYTANGAVFPMGVYDARKRALQNEALKKKQQNQKMLELASIAAAPQYKQDLENMQFANIQYSLASVNGNADKLMDLSTNEGRKFWENHNKIKNVGNQTLWIQKRCDDLLKLMQDEKAYIPDSVKNLMSDWWGGGYYNAQEVLNDPKKMKELNNIYSKLKDYDNMTFYVSQNIEKLQKDTVPIVADWNAKISELPAEKQNQLMAIKQSGDFNEFLQVSMKYIPDLRAGEWVEGMYKTHDFGVSKPEFAKYVWSQISKDITPKITVAKNNNLGWANRADRLKAEKDLIHENYRINTNTPENKTKLFLAAQNGVLKETIKNITGLGEVKTDKNGKLFQEIGGPDLVGKKGSNSLKNVTLIEVGGNRYTPEKAKNFFGNYTDAVVEDKNAKGEVTGYSLDPFKINSKGLRELSTEEQEFVKYLAINGTGDDVNFNTQFRGGKVFQKSKDANGKEIIMEETDYTDQGKVSNMKAYSSMEADAGYYDGENFIKIGRVITTGDLDNDQIRSANDAYYTNSNTKYGLQPGIMQGGTGQVGESSDVIDDAIYED